MTAVAPSAVDVVARYPAISLDETVLSSALQTRIDRKYVVPPEVLVEVLRRVEADASALEIDGQRAFGYRSIYFDTPDLVAYLRAARTRPNRFKVRTRTYLDSGLCALEVKTRDGRGRTVKLRLPYRLADAGTLTGDGYSFVRSRLDLAAPVFEPVLEVRYERSTLVLAGSRITIDRDLRVVAMAGERAVGAALTLPDALIVETKTSGRPSAVDVSLWAAGVQPLPLSKYGVGMAGLHPSLPANRWNRVLRRHFGWTPARR